MQRRLVFVAVLAALGLVLLIPATSQAQPVVSRAHFEFSVRVDDCGIGTLDLSIDAFNLVNLVSSPDGTLHGTFTTVDVGTGFDAASAITYRFVDRFTQAITIRADQPSVETAERTLVITGGTGGLLARGVVHSTVQPDGTVVSDVNLQFVRCL
jgi:hypothetical protein